MAEFEILEGSMEAVAGDMVDYFCDKYCKKNIKDTCDEIKGIPDSLCKKARGIWDVVIRKEEN